MALTMKSRSRLYIQILSYFLTMTIMVVAIVAIAGYTVVRRNGLYFGNQIAANMSAVGDRVSTYFERVYSACQIFTEKMNAGGYLKNQAVINTDDRYGFISVRDALEELQITLDDAAESVFVYSNGSRVYTNIGVYPRDGFFTRFNAYAEHDESFWVRELMKGPGTTVLPADSVRNHHAARRVLVKPVTFRWFSGGQVWAVVVNLRVDDIVEMYYDAAVFLESEFAVYEDNAERSLHGTGVDLLRSLSDRRLEPGAMYTARTADGRVKVSATHNEVLGWTVLCITPAKVLLRSDSYRLLILAVIGLCLIAISVLSSLLYAKRIYRPIRSLSEVIQDLRGDVDQDPVRSVNELEQIDGGLRDIWRRKSVYETRSRIYSAEYARQGIRDLLVGRSLPDSGYLMHVLHTEFGFSGEIFQCAIVAANERGDRGTPRTLPPALRGRLERRLASVGATFTVTLGHSVVLFVLNAESDVTIELYDAVTDCLCGERGPQTALVIRAGVGLAHNGLISLADSFAEAGSALMSIGQRSDHAVVSARSMSLIEPIENPVVNKSPLVDAIRSFDTESVRNVVLDLLPSGGRSTCSYNAACATVRAICEVGYEHLVDWGQPELQDRLAGIVHPNPIEVLLARPTPDPEPIVRYYEGLVQQSFGPHSGAINPLTVRVKRFVDLNYSHELSLDIIGDNMGVSGKYLSRVFKQDVQMNLSDYVAYVRVRETKVLLQGELTLARIAERVGLPSRTSFVRTFKKIEGMSPSAYRQTVRSGKDHRTDSFSGESDNGSPDWRENDQNARSHSHPV